MVSLESPRRPAPVQFSGTRSPSSLVSILFGLRGRLFLALGAISLFVIIAAGAGLYAFHKVTHVLDVITIRTMPPALAAAELSRESQTISAIGPKLLNARDANEIDALSVQARAELVDASTILERLRAAGLDDRTLDEIYGITTKLSDNLISMRTSALDRIIAGEQKAHLIRAAAAATQTFTNIWRPHFTSLRSQVLQLEQVMGAATTRPGEIPRALDQFDAATITLFGLDQLQHEVDTDFQAVTQGALVSEPSAIGSFQTEGQRTTGAIDGLVSNMDVQFSAELSKPLDILRAAATGKGSVFEWTQKEIAAQANSRRLSAANETLSAGLTSAVARLVAHSRAKIESANDQARQVQALSRHILLTAVALSLVCSFLIVWLYVGRNIVARLTRLSRAMSGIASGARDTAVPISGIDEIAAMGRAVEVFRQNAIERDTLLAERAEAAERLERLVADRTAQLARNEAALRVMFDNMPQGVAMFDRNLLLTAWNRPFRDLLRLPDAFLQSDPSFDEFFRLLAQRGEFGPGNVEEMVQERLAITDRPYFNERTRPDGVTLEVRRNPIAGGGFVSMYTDITERKRAEGEIHAARDAAENALKELQAAQANLVHAEKMASLGQLTAGIAHEIKNPLNFVNNFAGLSVELLAELRGAASPAVALLAEDARAEIDEIVATLSGNLEKIAEHGKRADGIVTSMLLHSRGGSGERRKVDLNALVDEALNLAYHGARAQDQSFTVALERDFARELAPVELVPQEMTRVFLNLFANGFYAAGLRQKEGQDPAFRPILSVATRDLGETIEVSVRDNGAGIPPAIRDKLFQPFFTTKPTGEGTGLGLSISYDIVTQQHGGTIAVKSEIGDFTEFTVRLPRRRPAAAAGRAA